MVADITSYIETIQELNVQLAGSQNGKEARPVIAEIFSTMLEMLDVCDYSSQTENIYLHAIDMITYYAPKVYDGNNRLDEHLEYLESIKESMNSFISKFPPSTDETIIKMAINDENDNILVDENGDKLELEFSAILFDEEE